MTTRRREPGRGEAAAAHGGAAFAEAARTDGARGDRAVALGVAATAFALLAVLAARDLGPFDSSEFVLNAAQVGVGHPPGQPAYALLGAAIVRLLGGRHDGARAAFGLSLLSALATAISTGLAAWLALAAARRARRDGTTATANAKAVDAARSDAATSEGAASDPTAGREGGRGWAAATVLAALLVPGAWDLATRAELYSFTAAIDLGALVLALGPSAFGPSAFGPSALGPSGPGLSALGLRARAGRWSASLRALGAGLLVGLAASTNPVLAFAVGPAVLLALVDGARARAGSPGGGAQPLAEIARALAWAIGGGLLGLLPYALLPWAGAHAGADRLVWGAPLDGPALVHFLAGRDYRGWGLTLGEYARNLGRALGWLVGDGLAGWIALGAIGSFAAPTPRALRLAAVLAPLVGIGFVAANHPLVVGNPDYAGYLLPALGVATVGVARLALRLVEAGPADTRRRRLALAGLLIAALAVDGAARVTPLSSRPRGGDHTVHRLASAVLDEAPPNAILLVSSDHLVFPLLVLTELEGRRPDVLLLDEGWASSRWAWDHLRARHDDVPPVDELSRSARGLPLPPREGRIAALVQATGRPLVAETWSLAALGGGEPCRLGVTVGGGRACAHSGGERAHGDAVNGAARPVETATRDDAATTRAETTLAALAAAARPGTLEERVVSHAAITVSDAALSAGDAPAAMRLLVAGVSPHRLVGLDSTPPPAGRPIARPTPLREPRALLGPDVALLKIGDVLRATDSARAASFYARSGISEADELLVGE